MTAVEERMKRLASLWRQYHVPDDRFQEIVARKQAKLLEALKQINWGVLDRGEG